MVTTNEKIVADMRLVQELLLSGINWREKTKQRYHKFILHYIKNGFRVERTAKDFHFSTNDMLSIFARIEKELSE